MNEPTNLIQWNFDFKKTDFNTYNIEISAKLEESYRLYSQESDLESPLPTIINFEENTFVYAMGDIKEKGELLEGYNQETR